jgi:hypothetical protein
MASSGASSSNGNGNGGRGTGRDNDEESQRLLQDEKLARAMAAEENDRRGGGNGANGGDPRSRAYDPYFQDPYYQNMPRRYYYGAWRPPAPADGQYVMVYRDPDPDLHYCWYVGVTCLRDRCSNAYSEIVWSNGSYLYCKIDVLSMV